MVVIKKGWYTGNFKMPEFTEDDADDVAQCCSSCISSWICFSIGAAIALSTGDSLSLVAKCILCFPFGYMTLSLLIGESVYALRRGLKIMSTYAKQKAEKRARKEEEEEERKRKIMGPVIHRAGCLCSTCSPGWQERYRTEMMRYSNVSSDVELAATA